MPGGRRGSAAASASGRDDRRERAAIAAAGLTKRYGKTAALRDVSLQASAGTVTALLGPNGAGKTTVVRILSTLLRPDAGTARVGGYDVARDPERVRALIGLTGQSLSVDGKLSGPENLAMFGRLHRLAWPVVRERSARLLDVFDLGGAGKKAVKAYSGGMRRKLDLALSLMAEPPILFLDEPTAGLDPTSRHALWDIIRGLVGHGTTVLLTTQYLDEADALAGSVVFIDAGRVVDRRNASRAQGTGRAGAVRPDRGLGRRRHPADRRPRRPRRRDRPSAPRRARSRPGQRSGRSPGAERHYRGGRAGRRQHRAVLAPRAGS